MSFRTFTADDDKKSFARIPVGDGVRKAMLQLGHKKLPVEVVERGIAGYTLKVPSKYERALRNSRSVGLLYDGSTCLATVDAIGRSAGGKIRVEVAIKKDTTKSQVIRRAKSHQKGRANDQQVATNATIAYGGLVILLFLVMALPGLGDQLGTADRIEGAVNWLIQGIGRQF